MNPELYERYLAKKAKKLGITVEELKAQGTSSPVSEPSVTSSNTEQMVSQEPQQQAQIEPQYVQRTIQDQLASQENTIPQQQPYMGMQPETVKTEVPSYVFGPSKIKEAPKYNSSPINQNVSRPEIKDNRENKFGLIGYPLGHLCLK